MLALYKSKYRLDDSVLSFCTTGSAYRDNLITFSFLGYKEVICVLNAPRGCLNWAEYMLMLVRVDFATSGKIKLGYTTCVRPV